MSCDRNRLLRPHLLPAALPRLLSAAGRRSGHGRARCARLQLVAHAPSLAGVESLVSEPRLTSHKSLGPEGRAAMGIPDGFIRLSCGIEDAADIIADFEQALEA